MNPPKVFISATSGDLRSIRQIVKEALLTIGCHPVEQTNFGPDFRTVRTMLEEKIGECQAMIHITGMRYGAEPDPSTLPPAADRRSYTQMEYEMGRHLQEVHGDKRFRVYTFVCPEGFPYDEEPDAETVEKRELQIAHRERLLTGTHLHESPKTHDDIKHRTLSLQEQVRLLKIEQGGLRATTKAIFASLLLLAVVTVGGFWFLSHKGEPPPPPPHKGEISVVVVMGENVDYERIMRDACLARLKSELAMRGYTLKIDVEDPRFTPRTYASPTKPEGAEKWAALCQRIELSHANQRIDYFITLGTHATTAIKQFGLNKKFDANLVYLGVTDPYKAKFANNPRTAGVQYGTGGLDYGRVINTLFKQDQRLVFLYNEGVPQDEFFREDLEKVNAELASDGGNTGSSSRFQFEMKPADQPISLKQIQEADPDRVAASPIYFAWYGLDNILSDPDNLPEIVKKNFWVVPSTYSKVNLKTVGVVVSVDDKLVGEMGADIILRKIDDPQRDLRQERIGQPTFRAWICRDTIAQNFIERAIKQELLTEANRSKYPWISFDDAN